MTDLGDHGGRYLALDKLTTNLQLARRLPRDLAFRFHALPVAEDVGRVTVAMADPNDADGQLAVATALGTMPYVVQAYQAVIDALLAELWHQDTPVPLHLLIYNETSPAADELSTYTQLVGDLLDARISHFDPTGDTDSALDGVAQAVAHACHDLIICGRSCQPLIDRLLFGMADCRAVCKIPTSLLFMRSVRWPLKRILFVVRQECAETNEAALEWVGRLARPSGASVTVLVIVPPVPVMYNQLERFRQGLTALLSADSALGREMRKIARHLADWDIEGTLRLRQGPPGWQLRLSVAEGDYDLLIVGADSSNRWLRWLTGGQVNPLLRWADRPVLVAKPPPAKNEPIKEC